MGNALLYEPGNAKELDLPTGRAGKPIKERYAKGEPHETDEVALNVNLKCGTFEFKENFTLCEMDEVDLILGDTFFETHTVDVRRKPVRVVLCRNGKKNNFEVDEGSYGGRKQAEFGLDRPNDQ
jgi:hypothetical protein